MKAALTPIVLALAVSLPAAARAQEAPPAVDWSGAWGTRYGRLVLTQTGAQVEGSYGGGGALHGTVAGRRLTFRYEEPTARGEGWFELAPGGERFAGKWREAESEVWRDWAGERLPPPQPFTGLFRTRLGPLRLVQDGARVRGTYRSAGGPGTVEGTVEGAKLTFRWAEAQASGDGWFEVDGDALDGGWRIQAEQPWRPWRGRRLTEGGVRWLYVVEAQWETSLAQREYAFGSMLREFFRRYPRIEVRHRRFHDRADLERELAELPFLPGSVVLVVASHGTAGQLVAADGSIEAAAVGRAVDAAPNVELVHFSACEMLVDGVADRVRAALKHRGPVPISGYASSVDWSASALLEMLYLDLVLGRGKTPAEAAAVVRSELRFAGDVPTEGSPLGAARFRFVE